MSRPTAQAFQTCNINLYENLRLSIWSQIRNEMRSLPLKHLTVVIGRHGVSLAVIQGNGGDYTRRNLHRYNFKVFPSVAVACYERYDDIPKSLSRR